MSHRRWAFALVFILVFLLLTHDAEAKRRRRKRYTGPPPTHPVIIWSKTLSQSTDLEKRRVAAFKLSRYTQRIYQPQIISVLQSCMKDPDLQIRIFCIQAMGKAGRQNNEEVIRSALLERFHSDPAVRNTVVQTLIERKDNSEAVHDTLLKALKNSEKGDERLRLLSYFEQFGSGSNSFVSDFSYLYEKYGDSRTRRSIVKTLSDRGRSQDKLIELLVSCANSSDTPLALTCLAGLQQQGKSDKRSWQAVEKTLEREDPDVIIASLDLINEALPETTNVTVAGRLLQIISSTQDPDIQEKAVLALGATGDQSEEIVKSLLGLFEDKETEETIKVASALALGQQGSMRPEKPKALLDSCTKDDTKTQSLKTACQIGLTDLDNRVNRLAQASAQSGSLPAPTQASVTVQPGKTGNASPAPTGGTKTGPKEVSAASKAGGASSPNQASASDAESSTTKKP